MSLKIIQILHHSPSWTSTNLDDDIYGGWHVQTAQAIQKLGIKNCHFECWLPEKTYRKESIETKNNITYRIFPSRALSYGREISIPLINAIKQDKSNQIILHTHGIFNYLTYTIAKLFKMTPIIAQHHGDCPPLHLLQRRKILYSILPLLTLENSLFCKSLRNIDHFFCLTKTCQHSLAKLGIKNKSSIQTMGVDFNQFVPAHKTQVRKTLGLSTDAKIMLYVGRLDHYKASNKVIIAFNKIKAETNTECVIVGAQSTDAFYNLASQSGIKILPRQPHNNLQHFYQAADVLVLPGSDNYNKWGGIGVNVLESLACNTPVVSGTLRHFPADYSQIGVFAQNTEQVTNSIKHIFNNPTQFSQCRTIAQKYYDWQTIAQNTFAIYEHLFLKYYNIKLEILNG